MSVTATLLLVTAGVLLALVVSVIGRKASRDLDELRSASVRADLLRAVEACDVEALAAPAIGRRARQADLLAVLRERDRGERIELGRLLDASPAGPAVRATLERRLRARRAPSRGLAALVIAELELPYAAEVVTLAEDPDADVRMTACAALARIGTQAAAEELIACCCAARSRRPGSLSDSPRPGRRPRSAGRSSTTVMRRSGPRCCGRSGCRVSARRRCT